MIMIDDCGGGGGGAAAADDDDNGDDADHALSRHTAMVPSVHIFNHPDHALRARP